MKSFAARQAARRNGPQISLLFVFVASCLACPLAAAAAEPVTITTNGWRVTIADNAVNAERIGTTPAPGPVVPGPVTPTPPAPTPGLPEGVFGAARQAKEWATAVQSMNRLQDCLAIAEACEAIAKQAQDGKLDGLIPALTAKNIAEAFLAEITRRLGNDGQKPWLAFGDKMVALVKVLFAANKLPTGKEWAVLLREIGAGVAAAK